VAVPGLIHRAAGIGHWAICFAWNRRCTTLVEKMKKYGMSKDN
jgi:hypothetical protein